jgi:hypothetical protein
MKHDHSTPDTTDDPFETYIPILLRARHDGWTADRQCGFLRTLAETGCISEAVRCRHRPALGLSVSPPSGRWAFSPA